MSILLLLALAGPPQAYPVPGTTPGALNPLVTQATIATTICKPGWTKTVRPSAHYTNVLKLRQMRALGLHGSPRDYEEDHFISLELGGCPACESNLWPEAYRPAPGAHEKDVVENHLHAEVCAGRMTLDAAQKAIATDWYAVYLKVPKPAAHHSRARRR